MSARATLIVMLKEPRPGRVKTRLGADIGLTASASWFRHQVRRLLRDISDPRWDLVLAVAPDRAGMLSRAWPAHLPRLAQGHGDLGARMTRALGAVGPGPVCLIGADIPGLDRGHIARAFAALRGHDAVLGPAPDGGFWLVGLRNNRPVPRGLFAGARWSTPHALADAVDSLTGSRIAFCDKMRDVDTGADLAAL